MKRPNARQLHKCLGLPLCLLLFLAALSGILLNHRELLQSLSVPRYLLPAEYSYSNWNGGAVRGALRSSGFTYLYGASGVWRSDSALRSQPIALNEGIAHGGDEQKVMAMTADASGRLWMISQFRLYMLDSLGNRWLEQSLPEGLHGRLTDLVAHGDSLLLLSRSQLYLRSAQKGHWQTISWAAPVGYTGEILLFRIVWALHSGEYFGLAGRLAVDIIGLVVMGLCATGIFYTFYRKQLQRAKHHALDEATRMLRHKRQRRLGQSFRWHNLMGQKLLWVTGFVLLSGWLLRPPLMLPLIFTQMRPASWSELGSDNPWFDRLRSLRYDKQYDRWLLSTSEGFFTLPSSLLGQPKRWEAQPQVSPMGVTVLEQRTDGSWLVGSFSGLSTLDPNRAYEQRDYFSRELIHTDKLARPVGTHQVAGAILGAEQAEDRIFLYDRGAVSARDQALGSHLAMPAQPEELNDSPYSLWQAALELHAGRLYKPFLGKWGTDLFIFFLGLASLIVLVTGTKRLKRSQAKHKDKQQNIHEV